MKNSILKKFYSDTFIFGIGNLSQKIISLILILVITKNLSINEFGIYDFLYTISNVIIVIIIFGQDKTIHRFYYLYHEDKEKKIVISQSVFIILIFFLFFYPFIIYFSFQLLNNVIEDTNQNKLLLIYYSHVPFWLFFNMVGTILNVRIKKKQFIFLTFGSSLFFLAGILTYITLSKISLEVIFLLYFYIYLIFSIIGFFFIRKDIIFNINLSYWKELFYFSLPYGVVSCISFGVSFQERNIIFQYLNLHELGIYALGVKIALILFIFITSFQTSWQPYSYVIYEEKNYVFLYNLILSSYLLISGIIVFIILIFSENIIYFLSSLNYINSKYVIFPIIFSYFLIGMNSITTIGISISKKTIYKVYSSISSAIISLLSMFLLINFYGSVGIAWSIFFGTLFYVIIENYFSYKIFKIRWQIINIIFFILFLFIICFLIMYEKYYFNSINIYIKIINILIFSIVSIFLVFSKNQRFYIYNLIKYNR